MSLTVTGSISDGTVNKCKPCNVMVAILTYFKVVFRQIIAIFRNFYPSVSVAHFKNKYNLFLIYIFFQFQRIKDHK